MKPRIGVVALMLCVLLMIVIVIPIPIVSSTSSSKSKPKDPFIGIAPQDEKYYRGSSWDVIKCKDGSKTFTKSQLNDDFCDCPDATDEPGTSACPNGKFYCPNAGHAPLIIFSSRVNDGICDCCDGGDEYDGKVQCPNTCWEAGKTFRDELAKKIITYQEGVMLRKHQVEQAKLVLKKDEARLLKLKGEENTLSAILQQLKAHKDQIEKAEELEHLRLEKEQNGKAEAEEKSNQENTKVEEEKLDTTNAEKQSDKALDAADVDVADERDDSIVTADNTGSEESLVNREKPAVEDKGNPVIESEADLESGRKENDLSENMEALSKEELGRLIASRWTGEYPNKQSREASAAKDKGKEGQDELLTDTQHEEYDNYASDTDDDSQRYEDGDMEDEVDEDFREDDDEDDSLSAYKSDTETESYLSDHTSTSGQSWLEKIQQTVQDIFQAVNLFQTPVNQSDAARIRKEYDNISTKLPKIQSRISSLTQKLKHDFGPEKEFYSLYGHCFESKQYKYVYKVCPYKQASQEEGYTTTHLGQWDKFEESYTTMIFSNGERCWNGPDRSLKVKLRCGLTNEVTDVDEPSRCEYVASLSTPGLCREEKLKELQQKLELLNEEQPQAHDEL